MKRTITFYNSYEEQKEDEAKQLASLSSEELMLALRKLINISYTLSGFNMNKVPKKHNIKITEYQNT